MAQFNDTIGCLCICWLTDSIAIGTENGEIRIISVLKSEEIKRFTLGGQIQQIQQHPLNLDFILVISAGDLMIFNVSLGIICYTLPGWVSYAVNSIY